MGPRWTPGSHHCMAVLWVLRRYGLSIGMCAEVLQECAKQSGAGAGGGGGQAGVSLWCVEGRSTLLFIWAGPLTSTEKGFFLGMSGCKLLGRLVVQMNKKTTQACFPSLPPLPHRPQAPASPPLLCPRGSPGRQDPHPLLKRGQQAWHREQLDPRLLLPLLLPFPSFIPFPLPSMSGARFQ